MRKKTKSKKIKQKQKQKQSQNVRQTVNVNLGNISKRRPQRRTGTRTSPMVTYQQTPIPLAPSVDYGKLEHTISSLQNNILHSINNRQSNNLMNTPRIQQPARRVNLSTQTPIPSMVNLATQTTPSTDESFPIFLQTRELTRADEKIASQGTALEQAGDAIKQMNIAMGSGAVRQTGIPEVEGIPKKGRPKKGTQVAEPVNVQEGFVSPEPRRGQPKPQLTGEFEAKPNKKQKKKEKFKDVKTYFK